MTYILGEEGGYVYSPREDLLDRYDDEEPWPTCGGSGEVYFPCKQQHQYACGNNPACSDDYATCPGCSDCED